MQDPELAAAELERCVTELGFRGAMVNGFSQVGEPDNAVYYDQPQYRPFWAAVERLGVPFYLHPRSALPRDARLYAGHPWLMGAAWGYGNETAVHALRLIGCGLFDEFPRLTVVIGHMGEGIPFNLWRLDNCNAGSRRPPITRRSGRPPITSVRISTSRRPATSATVRLIATILEIGADRVMFSVDWPFELIEPAVRWFDQAAISDNDRRKIGRDNALRLLKLDGR